MMVMTAKVDAKKIGIAIAVVAAVIIALIALLGGGGDTQTAAPALTGNDGRVAFLKDFGWVVSTSPTESSQVRIPTDNSEVFQRYNALQKSQGYDLSQFAGKTVMRYVYKVENYPGATDPVYATVLVYKDQIIGGDVTNTGVKGVVQGFRMPTTVPQATVPQASEPTDPSTPTS